MNRYPSIPNLYKRDKDTHRLMVGELSCEEFKYLKDITWHWYEKIDGTNIRVIYDGVDVYFGGRTDKAQMHGGLLEQLTKQFPLELMKEVFPDIQATVVCLYGEGFGAGIQKGMDYVGDEPGAPQQMFSMFDVKIGRWWLTQKNVTQLADQLGCLRAECLGWGTLEEAAIIGSAPFPSAYGDKDAEGLVCRPAVDLFRRNGERVICKIKHKDFK